jgi:F-type H+-transporting ATPase subunit delta
MTPLARSYAGAFLQAAPETFDVDGFLEKARGVAEAVSQDTRLRAFFGVPAVPLEAKRKVLAALVRRAGLSGFGQRFFEVVLGNRRLLRIPEILSGIREESDRKRGVVAARLTVASALGPAQQKRIAEVLTRVAGRRVRLQVEVNPKILAGFVARIGGEVFDASATHAVEHFREQVKQTAEA